MARESKQLPDIRDALSDYFGFDSLRSGQDEVVEAVMAGRDALAIMPTGGGKSLCYQLPALCREGVTVVVSPLIALMKDQVDALQARNIPAAAINSSLGDEEYRQVMAAFRHGELKIIYVAPERFSQPGFMNTLRSQQISLLAVDEAHCLSQWGHDFRPDYLRLGRARRELGYPQTIALTATATEAVRNDILSTLELRDPAVIISGFERPNLDFKISRCDTHDDKYKRIQAVVEQWKTGIIYCSTRKSVIRVFEELSLRRINAVAYHAGMTDEEREFSQNAFISGRADVVVATNAFGMGIDRSDVRFVIHFDIPGSVEAYYQEAGRAGRDGKTAVCELLFNHVDLKTQEFFYEGSNPPVQTIRMLYNLLCLRCDAETHELLMPIDALAAELDGAKNSMSVSSALSVLIHAGAVSRFDVPGTNTRGTRVTDPTRRFQDLGIDREALEEKAARDHAKIDAITRYAYSSGCRQKWILDYFGETGSAPCGHCDQCRPAEALDADELQDAEKTILLKALSGVARASRRLADGTWEPIYGRGKIMDMLRGAKNANMHRFLTELSTYGILRELTDARMKALFRAMHEAGLLQTSGGEMPLVTLSPKGDDVMYGRQPAILSRAGWAAPQPAQRTAGHARHRAFVHGSSPDEELLERLKELRRDIAADHRIPAYRVMSNDALESLAMHKPTTREDALELKLKGVGPFTAKRYLARFTALIGDYLGK